MASLLATEHFWVDKSRFDSAERSYYELLSKDVAVKLTNDTSLQKSGKNEGSVGLESKVDASTTVQPQGLISNAGGSKLKKPKKMKGLKKIVENPIVEACVNVALATNIEVSENLSNYKGNIKPNDLTPSVKKNKKKNKSAAAKKNIEIAKLADETNGVTTTTRSHKSDHVKKTTNLNTSQIQALASNSQCTLVSEIAKAREHIKNSLEKMDGIATLVATPVSSELLDRVASVEKDNAELKALVEKLKTLCFESQKRITQLEVQLGGKSPASTAVASTSTATNAAKKPVTDDEDDDGVDFFASDSDEEENENLARIRQERLDAYAAKKSKKPALIAKSSLVLDVKPWDDETDLKVMEAELRKIKLDGLLWGASKFVPIAFGIKKLTISCVVEDEKVSIDWLTEEIEKIEDYVQSVDVAAFNKI